MARGPAHRSRPQRKQPRRTAALLLCRPVPPARLAGGRDAWLTARPLFTAYPDVYAVQDLRCQLAMGLGGGWN